MKIFLDFIHYIIKFSICYLFAYLTYKFMGPNINWTVLLLATIYSVSWRNK